MHGDGRLRFCSKQEILSGDGVALDGLDRVGLVVGVVCLVFSLPHLLLSVIFVIRIVLALMEAPPVVAAIAGGAARRINGIVAVVVPLAIARLRRRGRHR